MANRAPKKKVLPTKAEKVVELRRATAVAMRVLRYFERSYPRDKRPRAAIELARAWAKEAAPFADVRKAVLACHVAARMAKADGDNAACAAARAAGHAAATAHSIRHGPGADYYAAMIRAPSARK